MVHERLRSRNSTIVEMHKLNPSSIGQLTTATAWGVRGIAALILFVGGVLVTGLATATEPVGASNPSPLLYEVDLGANAINIFPATTSGNVAPIVRNTSSALSAPFGSAINAAGDLWVANENASIVEFTAGQLESTGNPVPAVVIPDAARPNALAFDADGDLWATTFNGGVQEFTPGQLASSGSPTPAVTIAGAAAGAAGLTFDAAGDLWIGSNNTTILEYTADQLTASGSPTPAVTLSGIGEPIFPTFDAKGDLWVSEVAEVAEPSVDEFASNQLTTSGSPTPVVSLSSTDFSDTRGLTFDTAGDLWVAGAAVEKFTPNQLVSSSTQMPAVTISGSSTGINEPGDVLIAEPPVVTSVSPAAGSGGSTVTINGAGFDYGSSVEFGDTPASSVTYLTPYELRAVAPPGSGTADVTVSTFAGTSLTSAADQFTYPPRPHGYWLVGSDGGVFSFGAAQFYGSTGSLVLQRPVVGIVATKDDAGYWLDASDGGVFSYGDAASRFYGSLPGLGLHPAGSGLPHSLDAPVVGMVPSNDDGGYFMVASDGGVFAFGDARFSGSCPGLAGGCAGAAVAVMPDHSGNGYWLVTKTGNVYGFGDAPYLGAPGMGTVTSAVATPDGQGYWILLSNGETFNYGDAGSLGAPSSSNFNTLNVAAAIFATSDGAGYWVSSALGALFSYGDAPYEGGMSGTHLNGSIIAGTGF
jgi:hypothetical protein